MGKCLKRMSPVSLRWPRYPQEKLKLLFRPMPKVEKLQGKPTTKCRFLTLKRTPQLNSRIIQEMSSGTHSLRRLWVLSGLRKRCQWKKMNCRTREKVRYKFRVHPNKPEEKNIISRLPDSEERTECSPWRGWTAGRRRIPLRGKWLRNYVFLRLNEFLDLHTNILLLITFYRSKPWSSASLEN